MADIPLGRADYHRQVPKEARIQTRNRYFEQNPVLTANLTALIARPALRRWLPVGNGPIRNRAYSSPGSFDGAAFVVSENSWWRVNTDGSTVLLTSGVNPGRSAVSMAATANIGTTPEFLFMADGRNLWLYIANGYATSTLTGAPANGDVVQIGGIYYQFTNASVDAGAPAGTLANPWLVALAGGGLAAFTNLAAAIGASGTAGTDYSTALTANDQIISTGVSVNTLQIRASLPGVAGNAIATTETGGALAWTGATMAGGGADSVTVVETPEGIGAVSVGYIASYVVVVPAQGEGINGRFWWVDPGETTIDPLDFATAERAPDPIHEVVVFVDQFWLPGQSTTEVWIFTGNPESPVRRLEGVAFDRGTWPGTAVQVKESMVLTDSDGGVFQFAGGLKRISNPSIEERIREAQATQAASVIV